MSREKSREKLELKLLGSPEVWLDGQAVTGFRSGKAQALLYYLAVSGHAQPRPAILFRIHDRVRAGSWFAD